ncbi:DUF551 domain-containing protein [Klebsiella oxytoca]
MIPDKDLTDDVLDEIIAGAKTSMEQYLALSLKAERKVWRQEGPTNDERIMAIDGIHSCERCGDEGWVVGEMGITRCACGQAGNSPVIPDDARDALTKALAAMEFMGDTLNNLDAVCAEDAEFVAPAFEAVRRVLAAAPQPQNAPHNIPEIIPGWIPVSERMPEGSEEVLCAKEFDGPGDWRKKVGYRLAGKWTVYGASWTPTHWMPLPAAPQEVKSE